jgi:hypothetical protein
MSTAGLQERKVKPIRVNIPRLVVNLDASSSSPCFVDNSLFPASLSIAMPTEKDAAADKMAQLGYPAGLIDHVLQVINQATTEHLVLCKDINVTSAEAVAEYLDSDHKLNSYR